MQAKKPNWKKILRWLPGVLISLIAIYAVFKFIDLDDLRNAFKTVKISFFIILFFINILGFVIRGKAWQVILGKDVTYKQSFFGICEGYFLNNVLPLRAGEIGRSIFVGRSSGKGTFYVLSTIVIERAFDIFFAAALVVVTLPYLIGMEWIKPIATIALILVFAGLFMLFLIASNKEKVMSWANRITKPNKIMNFILPRIQSILDGFSLLSNPSQFFLSLFWIGLNWVVWISAYYLAVQAVIPGAPVWWACFVAGVMALGVAIPSAPSALGVFEASFVGSLAILGGQSGIALAYALIMHLLNFVESAIFGLWGLIREGISFSQVLSTVGSNKTEPVPDGKENSL